MVNESNQVKINPSAQFNMYLSEVYDNTNLKLKDPLSNSKLSTIDLVNCLADPSKFNRIVSKLDCFFSGKGIINSNTIKKLHPQAKLELEKKLEHITAGIKEKTKEMNELSEQVLTKFEGPTLYNRNEYNAVKELRKTYENRIKDKILKQLDKEVPSDTSANPINTPSSPKPQANPIDIPSSVKPTTGLETIKQKAKQKIDEMKLTMSVFNVLEQTSITQYELKGYHQNFTVWENDISTILKKIGYNFENSALEASYLFPKGDINVRNAQFLKNYEIGRQLAVTNKINITGPESQLLANDFDPEALGLSNELIQHADFPKLILYILVQQDLMKIDIDNASEALKGELKEKIDKMKDETSVKGLLNNIQE